MVFVTKFTCSLLSLVTVEFKDYPIKTIATKGDLVTFKCNVTGVPKPRITWKKDGELVTNDNWHTVTTNRASRKDSTASQLQIRQVNKGDIAEYSCIAWNRGSVREVRALLLLTGKCLWILKRFFCILFYLFFFWSSFRFP